MALIALVALIAVAVFAQDKQASTREILRQRVNADKRPLVAANILGDPAV